MRRFSRSHATCHQVSWTSSSPATVMKGLLTRSPESRSCRLYFRGRAFGRVDVTVDRVNRTRSESSHLPAARDLRKGRPFSDGLHVASDKTGVPRRRTKAGRCSEPVEIADRSWRPQWRARAT